AAARSVQAAARSVASLAAGGRSEQRAYEAAHRARHRARRAGSRAGRAHAHGLAHPRRRDHVPGRPRQGPVSARVRAGFLFRRPDAACRVRGAARACRTCAARRRERKMTPDDPLALAAWRRTVAAQYAQLRIAAEDRRAQARQFRSARDELFRTHPESPIPLEQRQAFTGVQWYDYDTRWRVIGMVEPLATRT